MTDWDLIIECMRNAMQVVEKTRNGDLPDSDSKKELDHVRGQMQEVIERLTKLQTVLEHQGDFAVDELNDMLSKPFTGKQSEYRRTPRMEG